jgi:hypothetical protein
MAGDGKLEGKAVLLNAKDAVISEQFSKEAFREALKSAGYGINEFAGDLLTLKQSALNDGHFQAATRSLELIGKLAGLFVDQKEVHHTHSVEKLIKEISSQSDDDANLIEH